MPATLNILNDPDRVGLTTAMCHIPSQSSLHPIRQCRGRQRRLHANKANPAGKGRPIHFIPRRRVGVPDERTRSQLDAAANRRGDGVAHVDESIIVTARRNPRRWPNGDRGQNWPVDAYLRGGEASSRKFLLGKKRGRNSNNTICSIRASVRGKVPFWVILRTPPDSDEGPEHQTLSTLGDANHNWRREP
jgi:hypothetical protein